MTDDRFHNPNSRLPSSGSADRRLMFDSRRTEGVSGKRNGGYGFRCVLDVSTPVAPVR